ncbi:hypothetical protein J6590_086198 [Homalodisca vitripennis]|nr:hypothetical protein J6590_086198 [Homalodisca vitripennis]
MIGSFCSADGCAQGRVDHLNVSQDRTMACNRSAARSYAIDEREERKSRRQFWLEYSHIKRTMSTSDVWARNRCVSSKAHSPSIMGLNLNGNVVADLRTLFNSLAEHFSDIYET